MSNQYDPALYNEDLAPVSAEKRTWNLWHIAALWVGMCICVPTYQLAADLAAQGMSWWQGVLTVTLGNLIVLVPMILNAHAGTRYGIPFPVFARASYGVLGANVPALMRALVACGWFGIQTWIGGSALFTLINAFGEGAPILASLPPPGSELAQEAWWSFWQTLGLSPGQLLCFAVFWLINVYFIWKGTESIKWMESLAAPFLILAGLALLVWAAMEVGSFGAIVSKGSSFETTGDFFAVFFPSLTAMVGFWATLSLNIPDFTRFARSQRDQVLGQAVGLPPTMALFSFIGVAVTAATPMIFAIEKPLRDPTDVVARLGSPLVIVIGMLALSLATLSTNIAANIVSPANDFSNLSPKRISYKMGGYITAIIGFLMMPWKLLASAAAYLFTWLVGYSALLGPIGGVMISDYFLLRKKELDVDALYQRGGAYEYRKGFNWRAIIATIAGILPCLPGFLFQLGHTGADLAHQAAQAANGVVQTSIEALPRAGYIKKLAETSGEAYASFADYALSVYTYAWFVGFFVAGLLYFLLMRSQAKAARDGAKQAA